jgi:hypothetical protein
MEMKNASTLSKKVEVLSGRVSSLKSLSADYISSSKHKHIRSRGVIMARVMEETPDNLFETLG